MHLSAELLKFAGNQLGIFWLMPPTRACANAMCKSSCSVKALSNYF